MLIRIKACICLQNFIYHNSPLLTIVNINTKLFFTMNYLTDIDPDHIPPEINRVISLWYLAHAAAVLPDLNYPVIEVVKTINIECLLLMQQHGSHGSMGGHK